MFIGTQYSNIVLFSSISYEIQIPFVCSIKNDSEEIEKERLLFHLTFEDGTTLKSIPDKDHRRENYRHHKLTGRNKWTNMSKERAQMLTAA